MYIRKGDSEVTKIRFIKTRFPHSIVDYESNKDKFIV